MKLSTRLGIVVATTVAGLLLVGGMALSNLHSSMMAERRGQIDTLLKMSVNVLNQYQELEKSGKLTTEEAQSRAAQALMGLQNGNDYVFVRDDKAVLIAHAKKDKVGKVDMGPKMPDGRTLVELYRDELAKQGQYAFVEVLQSKPGAKADDLTPKLNGVTRFTPWGWTVGTGFFMDDIAAEFNHYAFELIALAVVILGATAVICVVLARKIYRQLGGEPDYAAEMTRAIAEGDLSRQIKAAPAGSIVAELEHMQSGLRSMISEIHHQSELVKHASAEIHSTMEEISAASAHSSEATSATASAVEEMVVSVGMIADSAHETEGNSERAVELAQGGESQVSSAASEIQQVSVQIESASGEISALAERTKQIGGIANVIKEIADQTNLLALNAAHRSGACRRTGARFCRGGR